MENLVASKLSTIEGLSTTEGLVYGDYCAILSTRWLYYTWLCILLTFITNGFLAQSLFTVFARMWLLTSVVLFMKKKFRSLNKVVSQRGFFAQSLFTVLVRIWLLTSVVLFMKRMFQSLDKVVSQCGFFAQSLFTVLARMWLLTSVVLFMKKNV